MKRYKVEYFQLEMCIEYIFEISKSGIRGGDGIAFWKDGTKDWQCKCKNDLFNGIYKEWGSNLKNWNFQNWKKDKRQGIKIDFK